jgi:prepilin-type N-terminal cleavage/methylation domain-containing protein
LLIQGLNIMRSPGRRLSGVRGFNVTELLVTCAIIGVAAAIATPGLITGLDNMRLGMSVRDADRELQYARLKAVAAAQPMRVRFNCPAVGQVRAVEVIGTAANPDPKDLDTALDRCDETKYPYKPSGNDVSRLTRPNNDGAVRIMQPGTTFTASQTLEFWPDGTVHVPCQALCSPGANTRIGTVTITLSRKGKTKNITVNGLGKIQSDR